MSLVLGKQEMTGGKDFSNEKPTEDQHVAICIGVWDIGIHESVWEGKVSQKRKLLIRFEVEELMPEDSEYKGKHKCINRYFNATLWEQGALRPAIEAIIGKALTQEEAEQLDLQSLVGKACMLDIIHKTRNGKVIPEIKAISKIPKKMEADIFTPDNLYKDGKEPEWLEKVKAKAIAPAPAPIAEDDDDEPLPF